MSSTLEGQVVAITGGARGQGEAHARLLVAEGAEVYVCDVLDDIGTRLVEELGAAATYVHLDVTSAADWQRLSDTVLTERGRLDALINNAGIMSTEPVGDFDVEAFRHVLDVNVVGTALGMRTCVPLMKDGGSIVNISSIAAVRVVPGTAAYSASKWAVKGLTRMAAREFADRRVRVNSVLPGVIATSMVRDFSGDEETVFTRHAPRLAVPRLGAPADVAEAVLFLISDRSAYITGTELVIDGGWVLG